MKKNRYTTADDRRAATSSILRGLGRGQGHTTTPEVPAVEPRLSIEDDDFILDDFDEDDETPFRSTARRTAAHTQSLDRATIREIATEVLDMFREELCNLLDLSATAANDRRLFCPICSHHGCQHYHAKDEYTVRDLVDYTGAQKSTIYTWIYHGRISRPVSENPHLWDPHVIACFKHDDKLVFENTAVYDRAEHLRLLKQQKTVLAKKRAATHAKRSAHAVRLNAARRKRNKPSPKKSTHARTSQARKR